jgi:hypothetical protein
LGRAGRVLSDEVAKDHEPVVTWEVRLFGDPRDQFAGHVAADVEGGKVTVTPIAPEECDDSVEESCLIADEEKGINVGEWDEWIAH